MGLREVPTGTPVLDWTVPKEWNIREAWIKDAQGEKVVDFAKCNLHVVNYSIPVRRRIRLAELKEHLFSLPETPDWIPYRTSYYQETWGFCLAHRQLSGPKGRGVRSVHRCEPRTRPSDLRGISDRRRIGR